MTHSRRLGLCCRVNLVPDLLAAQRIALFEENVHILYVAEMTQNFRLLLYLLTFEKPKNLRLPDVTFNKIEFDPTIAYGKKPSLLLRFQTLQYVVPTSAHLSPALRKFLIARSLLA
jgi:hypothetical protein